MMRVLCQSVSRRSVVLGAGAFAATSLTTGAQPDGVRIIRARTGSAQLRGPEGGMTAIRGFEGAVPGPVLRIKRGEELKVRLVNDLVTETAIHWHGVRVPNAMDGVAGLTQAPVGPGESFDYRFAPHDAGTFWYRASTRSIEDRALYGLLIVDETEPIDIDRDVTLIVDAWTLGADGSVDKDGVTYFTVNGRNALDIPVVANERVRLRLLNASRDQFITLRLDRHTATVMAIDGQPAEPFPARDGRIALSPGNRLDLFV